MYLKQKWTWSGLDNAVKHFYLRNAIPVMLICTKFWFILKEHITQRIWRS